MSDLKICKGECGKELPLNTDNFYYNKTHSCYFHKCIKCYNKERREYLYNKNYNITAQEVEDLFNKQNGKCKISGVHEDDLNVMLNVDHCHETGYVRGLLAGPINRGLGMFNHSVRLMFSGIVYLFISKVKIQWKLLNGTLKKRNK